MEILDAAIRLLSVVGFILAVTGFIMALSVWRDGRRNNRRK